MPRIKEKRYASWNAFKSNVVRALFGSPVFQRGRFLFRGQSNSDWPLSPSFDRAFNFLPREKIQGAAVEMFDEFKNDIKRLDIKTDAGDQNALLALGQHYGLPTRLLDWTENYSVAAFFAFKDHILKVRCESVAIWALDSQSPIWDDEYGVRVVEVSGAGNIRIRNQEGKFTLSRTRHLCLEDYVVSNKGKGYPLWKFSLPASEATTALADLDATGIHPARIFPEIEGSAQLAFFRTVFDISNKYNLSAEV
jgi:hypothetical protein